MTNDKKGMRWWVFMMLLMPYLLVAQNARLLQQVYPEKLHEDIDVLGELIHQYHPDPYRYHSREDIERVIARVKDSIRVPMDLGRFTTAMLPIFHAIGDANCVPETHAALEKEMLSRVPLLPLKVCILEDGVFVEEELKGFRSIPNGSRLISINGKEIGSVIEKLCDVIIADGRNITYKLRRIERELHVLYAMHIEQPSSFKVRYITPDGIVQEQTVFAMTGEEIQRSRKPEGATLLPWGAGLEQESGAMWITMRSLRSDELSAAGQRPEKFIDAMLAELKENKVHTLVIDLRGADGSDPVIAQQVFAAIARKPFRLLSGSTLRLSAGPLRHGTGKAPPEYHTSIAMLSQMPADHRSSITVDTIQYGMKKPMENAFSNKVYVVCDGRTRGTAAAFVMLAKRCGRARIFGEETGSNALAFTTGNKMLVKLPNSGSEIAIPLERHVPDGMIGGPPENGELPDHTLLQDPRGLETGVDAIRTSLLRLIRELR